MGLYFTRILKCKPPQWAYPEMHGQTKKDMQIRKEIKLNIYGFIPLGGRIPCFVVSKANPTLPNGWTTDEDFITTPEEIDAVRRSY